jgi:hypothetical protein
MGNNCGCNFDGEGGELAFDKSAVSKLIQETTVAKGKFRFSTLERWRVFRQREAQEY